jgi:hypothetical protein
MPGNTGKHPRTNLLAVMEGENEVGTPRARENAVRTGLPLHCPALAEESGEDRSSPGAGPLAQAALNEMLRSSFEASPWSSLSATTRRASA